MNDEEKNSVVGLALARLNRGPAVGVKLAPAPSMKPSLKMGVTVADVLKVFPEIVETARGGCTHCSKPHVPEWRRGGKRSSRQSGRTVA